MPAAAAETFTEDEHRILSPYFTNTDSHVFALTNLPETVKGALFARYSRSAKSLRRLFLDEFAKDLDGVTGTPSSIGLARAEKLYAKVFNEYGDDSVAQLGGAHLACEYVSNVLTKVLEWGRLMAYLEQSTRYVPYTDKLDGRWRYHVPDEIDGALRGAVSALAARLRGRAPLGGAREGARHAARHSAGRDAVERRHLRDRPG